MSGTDRGCIEAPHLTRRRVLLHHVPEGRRVITTVSYGAFQRCVGALGRHMNPIVTNVPRRESHHERQVGPF